MEKAKKLEKIRIKLKAYDHNLVDKASEAIVTLVKSNGAEVAGPIPLPTEKEIITILRSPHMHKDSREQFELRTHKRIIDLYSPSAKVIQSLNKYELPAGVNIEIKF